MSPAIDDYEKSFAPEPGQGRRRTPMIKNYAPNAGPVQAILITETNLQEAADWCGGEVRATNNGVMVPSIQGGVYASLGEYLVRENNKFHVMSKVSFESKYHEVTRRQDGPQFARGGVVSRGTGPVAINAGGSGEAYGDYPDYRHQIPDPAAPRGDSIQAKGWGLNSDSP